MEGGTLTTRRISLSRNSGIDQAFACRAETVECTCPDSCERDHGND